MSTLPESDVKIMISMIKLQKRTPIWISPSKQSLRSSKTRIKIKTHCNCTLKRPTKKEGHAK